MGEVEIPVNPKRVLVLDEYAAMNLLTVGIKPIEVIGSFQSIVSQEILTENGIAISQNLDAFEINFEAIAALKPDLIVFTAESAFLGNFDELSRIAPTLTLLQTAPFRETLSETGAAFDQVATTSRIEEALNNKIAQVAALAADSPTSISVLGDTFGTLFAVSQESPVSALIAELGLTRPIAQKEGEALVGFESIISISTEILDEHDADIIAVMTGVYYNETTFTDAPTFQDLPGVKAGNAVVIDGDMWFGTHPFAAYWTLLDIENLLKGEGQNGVGSLEDTKDRWASYQQLIG